MLFPFQLDMDHDRRAWATWALIALNVAVFAWTSFLPEEDLEFLFLRHGFRPEAPSLPSLFTSMFLHGGTLHLLGNLYFLWIFGRGLEQGLRPLLWIPLYLATGAAAAGTHALFVPELSADIPAVGASGAISGMLGASAILYPAIPVRCVFFSRVVAYPVLITLPAGVVAGLWFALQLVYGAFAADVLFDVAFWAHVGGFVAGAVAAAILHALSSRALASEERGASDRIARVDAALLARVLAGAGDPVEALRRASSAARPEACATFWLEARARALPLGANDAAEAARALARMGRAVEAGTLLRDYCRGPGDAAGEDRLLLEVGRALLRADRRAAQDVLRALADGHPDSPRRAAALRILPS